jgi:hypothetical protein
MIDLQISCPHSARYSAFYGGGGTGNRFRPFLSGPTGDYEVYDTLTSLLMGKGNVIAGILFGFILFGR